LSPPAALLVQLDDLKAAAFMTITARNAAAAVERRHGPQQSF
jgi:hypothetical protein